MAERVQVQGLGGQVPGIQPTIQRAGQYSIAQVKAPRNKLMDLADALSQVNPMLQQYVGVADQEAEMFEDELATKSPEEVKAMLQKTEGEFDKQVRKGAMSWLTSPINQKRKLQAVGQASSRLLMEQVYSRLDSPQKGDDDLGTSDIINLVQQDFIENNPGLSQSVLAQQGLQQAVNPQILPLVRQYDAQKSRVAKGDTAFGTTSVFYDLAKEGGNLGDYDESTSGALLESWDNLNAFSAAEQRDILGKVFENLAKNGMEEKADSLLLWASKNIKIGTADITELEYDGYELMIERTAEVAGKLEEKDRADLLELKVADFQNAHTDIEISGQGTYNGEAVNSINDLILKAKQDKGFKEDKIGLAQLRKNVDDFIKTDIDPKDFRRSQILRDPFGPAAAINLNLSEIGNSYTSMLQSSVLPLELLASDEKLNSLGSYYSDSFQAEIEEELNALLGGPIGSDKAEVTRQMKDFIRSRKKEIIKEQSNAIQNRIKFLNEQENAKLKAATSREATSPDTFRGLFTTEEEQTEKAKIDLNVFGDETVPTTERLKAFNNIWKSDAAVLVKLRLIANGEIPKVQAQQPKKYFSRRSGFGGTIGQEIKRVEYTTEERKKARIELVQIEAIKGRVGDVLLNEEPVTNSGLRFDPLVLNSKQFPLVSKQDIIELYKLLDKTPEEREAQNLSAATYKLYRDAVYKTEKIGEEDVLSFIRNQYNIFKFALKAID